MAVSWREFGKFILPAVPQCPRNVAANAAREAAISFCSETQLWVMQSEPSTIIADHALYTPDTPEGAVVATIVKVQFLKRDTEGKVIGTTQVMPMSDLDLSFMSNWDMQKGEEPRQYRAFEPDRIQLIPKPTIECADALVMDIALKPAHDAKKCPQFLFDSYAEAIGYGAKAQLAAIPNKPWSNPGMVSYFQDQFQNKINESRRNINRAYSRKGLRVRRRAFV